MIVRKIEGASHAQIAQEFGVNDRTVQRVWAEWRDREKQALLDEDPMEVVLEHLIGFRDLRLKAAEVFHEAAGSTVPTYDNEGNQTGAVQLGANSNARVGALRLMMDLRAREIDLRQGTNLLPKNLGKLQIELDVRHVVDQMVSLFMKYDLPPQLQDEMLRVLSREQDEQRVIETTATREEA